MIRILDTTLSLSSNFSFLTPNKFFYNWPSKSNFEFFNFDCEDNDGVITATILFQEVRNGVVINDNYTPRYSKLLKRVIRVVTFSLSVGASSLTNSPVLSRFGPVSRYGTMPAAGLDVRKKCVNYEEG